MIGQVDDQVGAAKAEADKALADAKQATAEAVHAAANAVEDTTITSTVKYRLSTDIGIRATELTVETHGGRVSLRAARRPMPRRASVPRRWLQLSRACLPWTTR